MNWQPIETAPRDGTLCALRFRDRLGPYEVHDAHFFHDDGFWYRVEPPTRIELRPVAWMPLPEPPSEVAK